MIEYIRYKSCYKRSDYMIAMNKIEHLEMELKLKNEKLEMEKLKNEALDAKEEAWKTKVSLQISESNFKWLQQFDIPF